LPPPSNLISPLKPKLKLNSNKSWEKSPPPSKTSPPPKTKLNPPKNKKKLPSLYKKKDSLKTPNVLWMLKKKNKENSNNVLLGELNTKPTKSTEKPKSKSSKPLKTLLPPN